MKSLILALTLMTTSFAYANSNELAVDLLKKTNTKIDISNLQLAQGYSYGRTCAVTDGEGFCTKYAEHVFTLQNYIYTNLAKYSYSYKTAENYDVQWRCWGTFKTVSQDYSQKEKAMDKIANYPADFKKEIRIPYNNQQQKLVFSPNGVHFYVKEEYQVLKTKLDQYDLVEKQACDYGDVGDESDPVCHGMYKWRTLTFSAPVNELSSFVFNCQAKVPADSKDSLDLTTEILNKVLNGEAVLKE